MYSIKTLGLTCKLKYCIITIAININDNEVGSLWRRSRLKELNHLFKSLLRQHCRIIIEQLLPFFDNLTIHTEMFFSFNS